MRLSRLAWLVAGAVALGVTALAVPASTAPAHVAAAPSPSAPAARPVLVLYDTTGSWGWLGGTYVNQLVALTGHLGGWVAHPVAGYLPGELNRYRGVVYLGSTYDEPIPGTFLDDVLATGKPVLWANDNIWELTGRVKDFSARYGFTYKGFDHGSVDKVVYHGTTLTRDPSNDSGVMDDWITNTSKVTVLATAVREDGSTFPWALRSGNLTYVGEIPLSYVSDSDRYLAFADLLYDVLAPESAARHQNLLRVQGVGNDPDPARLRAVVADLYGRPPSLPTVPGTSPSPRASKGAKR
jgi:uncharacterized protein YdaL